MRKKLAGMIALLALLFLRGCGAATTTEQSTDAERALIPTLQVTAGGERVHFVFQVLNAGDAPVALTFPSGQSAEFEVLKQGERIWRWSDDQMFTQAIREEELEAGGTRTYEAEWQPPPRTAGEFEAIARLAATGAQVDQAVRFSLP